MRSALAVTAAILGALVSLSLALREASPPEDLLLPTIQDFVVVDYLRIEQDNDPKFPGPRPVHVLAADTVRVFARTRGIERLDVLVQLSGTESFGVFSGRPDRNGLVHIEVKVPAGGSRHDFRVPGPEGKRRPGQVQPRTVFMLQPAGYVAEGIGISGNAVWVRLEE